jgi:glutamate racemase
MKIAFFDSGVGGLTVLSESLRQLPDEEYIYYADTENAPYGVKSPAQVKYLVLKAAEYLEEKGIEALVVACNTATSIAVNDLRKKYSFPIVGMEPAVKPAVELNGCNKRILVAATELTLKEERFKELVAKFDSGHVVDAVPLPGLVEYCEEGIFREDIIIPYLEQQFSGFNLARYSTLVLGCTHFPFYKKYFRKILPDSISIIDGNQGTIRRLKQLASGLRKNENTKNPGKIDFYISGKAADETSRFFSYLERLSRGQ